MEKIRVILHLDLDAFFVGVEVLENPDLRGKPVVVGGLPEESGVVAAASYPARAYGIRSAMPMYKALRLCPQLVVVPPRHDTYIEYSRRVMAILHRASALVEQASIDEAFVDLTYHVEEWENGKKIAGWLQAQVRREIGLSASIGVATNKLVAKIASAHDKPGGLTVVRPGENAHFLEPLPVRVLWGIGPVTATQLAEIGVLTAGQLARAPMNVLRTLFGPRGESISEMARGIDTRSVVKEHVRKSVSQERTFRRDLADIDIVRQHVQRMGMEVANSLRENGVLARTIALKLRYVDFATITRQMLLGEPTSSEVTICYAAQILLKRAWKSGDRVRLLGVAARDLGEPTGQLSFLDRLD